MELNELSLSAQPLWILEVGQTDPCVQIELYEKKKRLPAFEISCAQPWL